MKNIPTTFILTVIAAFSLCTARDTSGGEFLTGLEIEHIQRAQAIDARINVYADAALLRLSTLRERLSGIEPEELDPLEFFSAEDLLDGYFRILTSMMHNLEDAFENQRQGRDRVRRALITLRTMTQKAGRDLAALKKDAEINRQEVLIRHLDKAIDITHGARTGAEEGLFRLGSSTPSRP